MLIVMTITNMVKMPVALMVDMTMTKAGQRGLGDEDDHGEDYDNENDEDDDPPIAAADEDDD